MGTTILKFSPETLSVLNRLVTVLEKGAGDWRQAPGTQSGAILAKVTAPAQKPIAIPRPKYKSASGARVAKVANESPVLKRLGVTSKGCDLTQLSSPEVSQYYVKTWYRDDQTNPHAPISPRLLRVLKSRQRDLGISFSVPTGTLNTRDADEIVEALKLVGRKLLGVSAADALV